MLKTLIKCNIIYNILFNPNIFNISLLASTGTMEVYVLKSKSHERCKNDIIKRRDELHQLIENERINSKVVQKRSRELDKLIILYYKQCQELKEP